MLRVVIFPLREAVGDPAIGHGYSGITTMESDIDYDVITIDKSLSFTEVVILYSLLINDVIIMKMALVSFRVTCHKFCLYGNVYICVMVLSM